jgi:hypothetical protein
LQRGAVWKPRQVELLWDSLLRGFPIGSLLLSEKIPDQDSRPGKHGDGGSLDRFTHHILDGQQRCDAIALGFVDPFANPTQFKDHDVLWINLRPDENAVKNSTRRFALRLSTRAHRWGYQLRDDCARLSKFQQRESQAAYGKVWPNENDGAGLRAPHTYSAHAWPLIQGQAGIIVPFAWVLQSLTDNLDLGNFLINLAERLQANGAIYPSNSEVAWLTRLLSPEARTFVCSSNLAQFATAVSRLRNLRIPAIVVDSDLIHGGSEIHTEHTGRNIENLFVRINSQGTVLNGEELSYSLIKSRWPGIEKAIGDLGETRDGQLKRYLPMPASRLAILGFQCVLSVAGNPPEPILDLTITKLRRLADNSDDAMMRELKMFFGLVPNTGMRTPHIRDCLDRVETWLCGDHDEAIPHVLRTRIALHSPNTFLALLILAYRCIKEGITKDHRQDEYFKRMVPGIATILHFCRFRNGKSEQLLNEYVISKPYMTDSGIFQGICSSWQWGQAGQPQNLSVIAPPCQAQQWLQLDVNERFKKHATLDPFQRAFLDRICWNKDLLVFAQRKYMKFAFSSYDPAVFDIEDLRPWDEDHLLPTERFQGKHNLVYRSEIRHYHTMAGNFRLVALGDNRSRQDEHANKIRHDQWDHSFLKQEELERMSLTASEMNDLEAACRYAGAVTERIGRMYRDWYDTCHINSLVIHHEH